MLVIAVLKRQKQEDQKSRVIFYKSSSSQPRICETLKGRNEGRKGGRNGEGSGEGRGKEKKRKGKKGKGKGRGREGKKRLVGRGKEGKEKAKGRSFIEEEESHPSAQERINFMREEKPLGKCQQ